MLLSEKEFETDDAANIALSFYKNSDKNYFDTIMQNSPRLFAKKDFMENDVMYCLKEDLTDIVPYLNGSKILKTKLL